MATPTPAALAAQNIGYSLIVQLDNTLADLALDPDANPDDEVLAVLVIALALAERLIIAGKGGGMSPGYALAHVAPREGTYDERDITREHARATHSLRVLQSLYGPQQAPDATCPGGC